MSASTPVARPLSCWKAAFRQARQQRPRPRMLSTVTTSSSTSLPTFPPGLGLSGTSKTSKSIPIYPSPPSARRACPEPLKAFTAHELTRLDPTSSRTRLFSKTNIDKANVGDVLLVRFRTGEPFAGVCINIRRRGLDSGILLRNHVLRTATEMWVKVYSPLVTGIEIVQRAEKRARRARLTYMRKPKHDRGDLSGIVAQYRKTRRTIGAKARGKTESKGMAAAAASTVGMKK